MPWVVVGPTRDLVDPGQTCKTPWSAGRNPSRPGISMDVCWLCWALPESGPAISTDIYVLASQSEESHYSPPEK